MASKNIFFTCAFALVFSSCNQPSVSEHDAIKMLLTREIAVSILAQQYCPNTYAYAQRLAGLQRAGNINDDDQKSMADDLIKVQLELSRDRDRVGKGNWCKEIWDIYGDEGLGALKHLSLIPHPPHDPRLTDDQAHVGCSFIDGDKLFCPSPGTGMCWEKGHNPWKREAPARALDIGNDPHSPDFDHEERCG